jgi:hypothetical protein
MYGPTSGEILGFCALLLLVGALLGIGCNAGCGWVRAHVNVEVKS